MQTGHNDRVIWGSVVVLLLVILSASSYAAFLKMVTQEKGARAQKARSAWNAGGDGPAPVKRTNILVLGVDNVEGSSRSDTLILANVDPQQHRIRALSIPRDTRVAIPGRRNLDKINHAHSFGGTGLAIRAVEALSGVSIDYYVELDFKGFERVVDRMGGIYLDVEKSMRYTDKAGGLSIRLDPGYQHLNGKAALGYVRFRHDAMGDIGRVARQETFLKSVIRQAFRPRNLLRLPGVIREARRSVETNLSLGQMLNLAREFRSVKADSIVTAMLPGHPEYIGGVSYWVPDDEALAVELGLLTSDRLVKECTVDVLNGCGEVGAAKRVADRLREEGFTIGRVDNSDVQDAQATQIVDLVGDSESVARLYEVLDPATTEYRLDLTHVSESDIVIIVGRNTKLR